MLMTLHNTVCAIDVRFQPTIAANASSFGELLEFFPEQPSWIDLKLEKPIQPGTCLEKKEVLSWLFKKTGQNNLRWLGRHKACAFKNIQTTGNKLATLAKNSLLKALAKSDFSEVELQIINTVPDSEQSLETFQAEVPVKFPMPKRVCVWLKAGNEQHPVWFKIKTWKKVWLAQHGLAVHSRLQSDDFYQATRDISGLNSPPAAQFSTDKRLTQHLNANDILLTRHIETAPSIEKGQHIAVSVIKRGIRLQLQATAEASGCIGQLIKLKNNASNKSFTARVSGIKQAEVDL